MMLCDGNAVEYDKIIHSPVSLYEAKLRNFADVHKAEKKAEKKRK